MESDSRVSLLGNESLASTKHQWYRDSHVLSSIATLSVTAIGAVVLTLPAATATVGWVPTLFALVLFAVLGDLSNQFLVHAYDSCHHFGGPEVDMETLGRMLLGPRWAVAIRVTLILLLLGATSAVNLIAVDMVSNLLTEFGVAHFWFTSRKALSLANILLMWPLATMRDLSKLGWVSMVGFLSLMYVFAAVVWVCLTDPRLETNVREAEPATLSVRSVLALPIFSVIYCAQFQVLPLYESLPADSRRHISTISRVTNYAVALPIYMGFGLLPYFSLGAGVRSDFLDHAWPASQIMLGSRMLLALVNLAKFPLIALPLRDLLSDLIWTKEGQHEHHVGGVTWKGHFAVMGGVNALIFGVTAFSKSLGSLTDIIGSSCGVLIVFVFPAMLYLAIKRSTADHVVISAFDESASVDSDQSMDQLVLSLGSKSVMTSRRPLKVVAVSMLVLGTLVGTVSLTCSILLPPL
uniref:Amino acid transporter transmembrane domain-containing protein n=1 Tax=Pyramimonas obovata TaxID=1411642 RepID=A0A7S0RJL6_9CHLO|mmetsp:Transcript_35685/g.77889  ORF Transcript_35685/g.77889 Transcript_35685/m.77889 type:complete len:465 (+) Transcript_35685:337-1731(+)